MGLNSSLLGRGAGVAVSLGALLVGGLLAMGSMRAGRGGLAMIGTFRGVGFGFGSSLSEAAFLDVAFFTAAFFVVAFFTDASLVAAFFAADLGAAFVAAFFVAAFAAVFFTAAFLVVVFFTAAFVLLAALEAVFLGAAFFTADLVLAAAGLDLAAGFFFLAGADFWAAVFFAAALVFDAVLAPDFLAVVFLALVFVFFVALAAMVAPFCISGLGTSSQSIIFPGLLRTGQNLAALRLRMAGSCCLVFLHNLPKKIVADWPLSCAVLWRLFPGIEVFRNAE